MYIILIGWLYVTVLMAATEESVVAGVLSFVFYGLAPTALFLFVFGTPARRRAKHRAQVAQTAHNQAGNAEQTALADQQLQPMVREGDAEDTQNNQ